METEGANRDESAEGGETEEMDPLASSGMIFLSKEVDVFSGDSSEEEEVSLKEEKEEEEEILHDW